ncbi:MAG: gliding motility-associated C-terminal domain-containing protein, partial [Flavobacteriaceae bacterium]|nr:gliding motility-associated C-terminal domain-containing protein [Flavobacteriaceae bacterium]
MKRICLFCFLLSSIFSYAQDVSLYSQFNGRYDYTAIGNTMNLQENGIAAPCTILTESGAILNLEVDQVIQAAYLYWAGTGEGDFDVVLNGNAISAERIFSESLDENRIFFAAFSDVTEQVIEQGNGIYTLSELDLTSIIGPYCPSGTNFAGWAITVIFQDNDLPLNQINVYDGLQSVPTELTITLENLNVLDNQDAKIGFIAWEGDSALAVNEQLTINGNLIGNPPLNPPNNAFNGTNSFTEESDLFNMDIDFYGIQDNISIGDTSATIQLTSGQDFVMINNIITVLNSQLPDATISIENVLIECNSRNLTIDFIISNSNSTASLRINTPIAFYADSILIGQS